MTSVRRHRSSKCMGSACHQPIPPNKLFQKSHPVNLQTAVITKPSKLLSAFGAIEYPRVSKGIPVRVLRSSNVLAQIIRGIRLKICRPCRPTNSTAMKQPLPKTMLLSKAQMITLGTAQHPRHQQLRFSLVYTIRNMIVANC